MLFCCDSCGCVDESELLESTHVSAPGKMFCSACGQVTVNGKLQASRWHGYFPRVPFDPEKDTVVNRPSGHSLP